MTIVPSFYHQQAKAQIFKSNCFCSTNCAIFRFSAPYCLTRIVCKVRLWKTSFIYKYETSTTYPLYERTQCFIQINDILEYNFTLPTICLYPQSAFTHNPGTTHQIIYLVQLSLISLFKFRQVAFKQRFRL